MYGQEKPLPFLVYDVQALVGSHPVEPSVQLGILPKLVQVGPDLNENILGGIICIIMVYEHLTAEMVHPLLVLEYQKVKSIVPRFFMGKLAQDLFIRGVLQGRCSVWV